MLELPKILAVVGTTCSGKSELGIILARAFEGEVICADSRTVYKGMRIGTAKPTGTRDWNVGVLGGERPLMVEGIAHWGLDLVDPDETFTAAEFQSYADIKIREILERGHVPILVGGTGLYVRAVIDRPTFSEVPPNLELRLELAVRSNAELLEEIAELDPDTASTIDGNNRRRLERALEILRATGQPLAATRVFEPARYEALQLGYRLDRVALFERIDARVDAMVACGLIDEVRGLWAKYAPDCPGMSGIGYRELVAFFEGKTPLKEAIAAIKQDTRMYAKRQETWFGHDTRVRWVRDVQEALRTAQDFLK